MAKSKKKTINKKRGGSMGGSVLRSGVQRVKKVFRYTLASLVLSSLMLIAALHANKSIGWWESISRVDTSRFVEIVEGKAKTQKPQRGQQQSAIKVSASQFLPKAEIDELRSKAMHYKGFSISYSEQRRIANWVGYCITAEEAETVIAERLDRFSVDPNIGGVKASHGDYTNSGYDRGHMAAAADMRWSERAMAESFYMSNVCPQDPTLNRGLWRKIEEQCREWAVKNDSIWIITGPIISDEMEHIGKSKVAVPTAFFKVLCMPVGGELEAVGYVIDNKKPARNAEPNDFATTVDVVEQLTGLNFFEGMADDVEAEIEASFDPSVWK